MTISEAQNILRNPHRYSMDQIRKAKEFIARNNKTNNNSSFVGWNTSSSNNEEVNTNFYEDLVEQVLNTPQTQFDSSDFNYTPSTDCTPTSYEPHSYESPSFDSGSCSTDF